MKIKRYPTNSDGRCCHTTFKTGHNMICYRYESPIEVVIDNTIKQIKEFQKRLSKLKRKQ